ncbi:hypothetical protein L6452_05302 [Arctium lappa]|uniref:Uncharacterized protein n=1 Tax=Arctium lappa TaxID=4217 RepID=A0ACB9EFP1_ARCLA|nr:hypothetical protein L6452_05302 [Arctium lappa]
MGSEHMRNLRLLKIEKSPAAEDLRSAPSWPNGVDQVGMLGFRLRSLSSIRFERYTSSLFSSANLRLHRTFNMEAVNTPTMEAVNTSPESWCESGDRR